MELQEIAQQMRQAFQEYLDVANLKPGNVVVIGCSTSEVAVSAKTVSPMLQQHCMKCWLLWRQKKGCIWPFSAASI